ncbi:hypothetical protein BDR06DRAFT_962017 [Suillus hirtellus]|nr:hypothetical protein BDR06DRAFT_962017 [Suillus hirtellus]
MEASLVSASPDGSRPYTYIHTATRKSARNWIEDLHDMQVEDVCGRKEDLIKRVTGVTKLSSSITLFVAVAQAS